jgi:hypothetical protein
MNTKPNAPPVFQFVDSLGSPSPHVFGVWETSETDPEALSFSAGGPDGTDAQTWLATLPPDLDQARAHLDAGASQLALAERALASVPERLNEFAAELQQRGASFSFGTTPEAVSQPEAELMDLLAEIEGGGEPLSFSFFGGEEEGGGKWRRALQQFLDFVERLKKSFTSYAHVETRLGERLVARTAVGWMGDFNTAWGTELPQSEAALHRRTLSLALRTRDALVRTMIIVTQAAVKISVLLSTPITAPLALPAAYKYVQAVLAQLKLMPSFGTV